MITLCSPLRDLSLALGIDEDGNITVTSTPNAGCKTESIQGNQIFEVQSLSGDEFSLRGEDGFLVGAHYIPADTAPTCESEAECIVTNLVVEEAPSNAVLPAVEILSSSGDPYWQSGLFMTQRQADGLVRLSMRDPTESTPRHMFVYLSNSGQPKLLQLDSPDASDASGFLFQMMGVACPGSGCVRSAFATTTASTTAVCDPESAASTPAPALLEANSLDSSVHESALDELAATHVGATDSAAETAGPKVQPACNFLDWQSWLQRLTPRFDCSSSSSCSSDCTRQLNSKFDVSVNSILAWRTKEFGTDRSTWAKKCMEHGGYSQKWCPDFGNVAKIRAMVTGKLAATCSNTCNNCVRREEGGKYAYVCSVNGAITCYSTDWYTVGDTSGVTCR